MTLKEQPGLGLTLSERALKKFGERILEGGGGPEKFPGAQEEGKRPGEARAGQSAER